MPGLLEPEFEEPFAAWKKNPTPEASGALLKAVQPVIDSAVKTYATATPGPLLTSRARRLVLEALPAYDSSRAGLRTHLTSRLQGLRRIHASQSHVISIPEMVKIDSGRLQQAHNELTDQLGREPTDLELADHTGFSTRRLKRIRQADFGVPEGMLGKDPETGEAVQPSVQSANDDWLDFIYRSSQPTDQLIIEHTYGMNGRKPLSGQEIARRLGITPAAVSQRKAKIQKWLDDRESYGIL